MFCLMAKIDSKDYQALQLTRKMRQKAVNSYKNQGWDLEHIENPEVPMPCQYLSMDGPTNSRNCHKHRQHVMI
jgi:hypothetical protein